MADLTTAFVAFMAVRLDYPIILEGPAGAGKTELALALSRVSGMRIVRLQCFDGISPRDAVGHYNVTLQDLYARLPKNADKPWEQIVRETRSREFYSAGPLLEAIESPDQVILLIDEIDKIAEAFEAVLLELTNDWQISDPELGTIVAKTKPLTILTSNAARELSGPMRRRCQYLWVGHPTPELEAIIVAKKAPQLSAEVHAFIAGLAAALRAFPNLKKPPAISEMVQLARAMDLLKWTNLDEPGRKDLLLPFIAKRLDDIQTLQLSDQFSSLLRTAENFRHAKNLNAVDPATELTIAAGARYQAPEVRPTEDQDAA